MRDEIIEVRFETTAADYRRILFWYQRKRLFIVACVYVLIVLTIGWFLTSAAGGSSNNANAAPTIVFILLLMVPFLIGASFFWQIWRQAKKIENISEPSTATFSEDGLKIKNASATSESNWSRFHRVYVTESDFIFFPQDNIFYSIPKRFFRSESEIVSATSLLRDQLGAKAIVKTQQT